MFHCYIHAHAAAYWQTSLEEWKLLQPHVPTSISTNKSLPSPLYIKTVPSCNRVICNCILRVYSLVLLMGVSSFVVSCPMIVMRGNVCVLSFVLLIVFVSVHRLVVQLRVVLSQRCTRRVTWVWLDSLLMHGIHILHSGFTVTPHLRQHANKYLQRNCWSLL